MFPVYVGIYRQLLPPETSPGELFGLTVAAMQSEQQPRNKKQRGYLYGLCPYDLGRIAGQSNAARIGGLIQNGDTWAGRQRCSPKPVHRFCGQKRVNQARIVEVSLPPEESLKKLLKRFTELTRKSEELMAENERALH